MRYQVLAGVLALAAIFGISVGLAGVTAAPPTVQGTPHGTPVATLGWGDCKFKTLQLVYYDNNTSASVDLDRAGQWTRPTSDYCDIKSGEMQVIQGDGSVPTWLKAYFPKPVSYPSSWTARWDQGGETYYKYDEAAISYTTAGPGSPDSLQAGWRLIFRPSGRITDDSLNREDQ